MRITLYNIGKTDQNYVKEGISDYQKRIGFFVDFKIVDLPEIKNAKSLSPQLIKQKEGETLIKSLDKGDIVILLDENGSLFSSKGFSEWLGKQLSQGIKHLVFITGGAYGFSDEMYKIANFKMSLSKMTFTHQMVRLIFSEQLYRAFTIIKGIPYHND